MIADNQVFHLLIQGNTYAEYELIFANAGLNDEDINMSITQLIDYVLCNSGTIMPDEIKHIKEALQELLDAKLDDRYKRMVYRLVQELNKYYIPKGAGRLLKELRKKTKLVEG